MDGTPLKQKKAKADDELESFKKPKLPISKAAAKHILAAGGAIDGLVQDWLVRKVDTLVRERSYPPQLLSDDFLPLLGRFFDPQTALTIAEEVRSEYAKAFPPAPAVPMDFKFLEEAIRGDATAQALISKLALPVADDSHLYRHVRATRTQSF
jgi:hypothetical protein